MKYKNNLVNAYDNSIRYTDDFLARLIEMLQEQNVDAAMLYTSDHGEDIFDDNRRLFLHASPVPSYYQIHVPFLVWMSDGYRRHYPVLLRNAEANKQKNISSSASFFQTMLELGGVETLTGMIHYPLQALCIPKSPAYISTTTMKPGLWMI